MKRKRIVLLFSVMLALAAAGCGKSDGETEAKESDMEMTSEIITAEQAKKLMDQEEDYVILDVREESEYEQGHIAGAVLLPYTEIADRADRELPDKEQLILVYCRSGRRSAVAAGSLAALGYTNVKDFGGIIDWPYGTVTD